MTVQSYSCPSWVWEGHTSFPTFLLKVSLLSSLFSFLYTRVTLLPLLRPSNSKARCVLPALSLISNIRHTLLRFVIWYIATNTKLWGSFCSNIFLQIQDKTYKTYPLLRTPIRIWSNRLNFSYFIQFRLAVSFISFTHTKNVSFTPKQKKVHWYSGVSRVRVGKQLTSWTRPLWPLVWLLTTYHTAHILVLASVGQS